MEFLMCVYSFQMYFCAVYLHLAFVFAEEIFIKAYGLFTRRFIFFCLRHHLVFFWYKAGFLEGSHNL